jgi:rubredoxin
MYIYRCGSCGHIAPESEFKYGSGREFGRHPEHRYCPQCSRSIDWFGYTVPCFSCPAYKISIRKNIFVNCIAVCPVLKTQKLAVLQKYGQTAQEYKMM